MFPRLQIEPFPRFRGKQWTPCTRSLVKSGLLGQNSNNLQKHSTGLKIPWAGSMAGRLRVWVNEFIRGLPLSGTLGLRFLPGLCLRCHDKNMTTHPLSYSHGWSNLQPVIGWKGLKITSPVLSVFRPASIFLFGTGGFPLNQSLRYGLLACLIARSRGLLLDQEYLSQLNDQWDILDTEHSDGDFYPGRHVAGSDSENEESDEEKVNWPLQFKQRKFLQRLVYVQHQDCFSRGFISILRVRTEY